MRRKVDLLTDSEMADWIYERVVPHCQDSFGVEEDYGSILLTLPKPDRLHLLLQFSSRFTVEELNILLAFVWSGVEFPHEFEYRRLVRLFRQAGFVSDGASPPLTPLTIYRGQAGRFRKGMSWTTDKEKASWFARRFSHRGDGVVYTGEVGPVDVLALFDDRDEHEVVVDPRKVYCVTSHRG